MPGGAYLQQKKIMKTFAGQLCFCILFAGVPGACQPPKQAVRFVATTPCDSIAAGLLSLEPGPCEMMHWTVDLDAGGKADSFRIELQYGMSKPGTHGFSTKRDLKWAGHYSLEGGRLTLNPVDGSPRLQMLQPDANHLHLLDGAGKMMKGNAGFPYTMNRTAPAGLPAMAFHKIAAPFPAGIPTPAMYEGRTPCPYLNTFFARPDSAQCQLVKWRLVFYPAENSGSSGRVKLFHIRVGNENTPHDGWGTWYSYRGWAGDPGKPVIQLTIDGMDPARRLTLVFMDENNLYFLNDHNILLTGDDYSSYTLSREIGF